MMTVLCCGLQIMVFQTGRSRAPACPVSKLTFLHFKFLLTTSLSLRLRQLCMTTSAGGLGVTERTLVSGWQSAYTDKGHNFAKLAIRYNLSPVYEDVV